LLLTVNLLILLSSAWLWSKLCMTQRNLHCLDILKPVLNSVVAFLVSRSILLPVPATSGRAIGVGWCGQDNSPCIQCRVSTATSLLYGISDILLRCLQAIQNAAARLVTGTRRCDHVTQVLQQLHWLPVWQRVEFKLAAVCSSTWRGYIEEYPPGGAITLSPLKRRIHSRKIERIADNSVTCTLGMKTNIANKATKNRHL